MPTRRTTVITLGTLLAGGGAVLGTGAFDTIEAERSVSLETAPDSKALLAFEIIDDEHVSQTSGTIDFDLIARATTAFRELVKVRNNGTQPVTLLRFEFDVTGGDQSPGDVEDALRIVSGDATIDAVNEANLLAISDAGDAGNNELSPGEAVPFGVEVDLTGDVTEITGDPEITLTIVADTGGESETGDGNESGEGDPEPGPPTFGYVEGPNRDPSDTPSRSLTFTIENTGGATTVVGFAVDIDTPGNSPSPGVFDGFEIEPAAAGEPTVDESSTDDDLAVGEDIEHAGYVIPSDSTAAYTIETFDRDPSQNGELSLRVFTTGGAFSLPRTGFESLGNA
ncbi:hypothetical protein HPS36_03720 [Halorubrum salinarum]|uniref:DUF1102 domain-containing protein n=1 Tax=Halorubrum salinarum TaxID=2739057 RepID=A0A7D4D315_9EURY|nr:hypothetical protein [Halorubrum salinarum]QKG92002.1 hypothetical protein HPS36_03720 [Halorubrum salinarum]